LVARLSGLPESYKQSDGQLSCGMTIGLPHIINYRNAAKTPTMTQIIENFSIRAKRAIL